MREFHARNPRFAPRRAASTWRRIVVGAFLALLGAGAAGGAYITTRRVDAGQLVELVGSVVR